MKPIVKKLGAGAVMLIALSSVYIMMTPKKEFTLVRDPDGAPRVEIKQDLFNDVSFAWDRGSDASLVKYKLYMQLNSGAFTHYKDVEAPRELNGSVETMYRGLAPNSTYRACVTAVNDKGQESSASNIVTFTPSGKTATVVEGFEGQLQKSSDMQTWVDVPSPYIIDFTNKKEFYRVQYEAP